MPPSLCCAHCNPKPKGTCCDFCSPSLTAELFSSIPSKVPQCTMYHTPKYEKTQADKDLLWAIDSWRQEEYACSWRHEHDLVGSSCTQPTFKAHFNDHNDITIPILHSIFLWSKKYNANFIYSTFTLAQLQISFFIFSLILPKTTS